jgi:hypothetical protein
MLAKTMLPEAAAIDVNMRWVEYLATTNVVCSAAVVVVVVDLIKSHAHGSHSHPSPPPS